MFDRLFPRRPRDQAPLPEPDAQLALGALLVRVALADRSYTVEEVSQIDRILQATFGLKQLEAAKLRASCEALERHAPGTKEFARILRQEVGYEDRLSLAMSMWKVVLADGRRKASEELSLHEIEAALGITDADSAVIQAEATGAAPGH
ncbi:TerB family tellurite resistance protein [Sulfitobacter sp. 20_GPM-1509m]|uniref:tellurite resistance TerB family protein n=1 Tax=Sulfitobacter sp. 20_GPM-1509m TaxID=1380367 RepID=UPI0004920350|nr:TerB family tellurite resistance protein [Sulfitobacter sp. 20_GPM-1509m]